MVHSQPKLIMNHLVEIDSFINTKQKFTLLKLQYFLLVNMFFHFHFIYIHTYLIHFIKVETVIQPQYHIVLKLKSNHKKIKLKI